MNALLKPRLILAIVVVISATLALVLGHLSGSEWAGAVIASMWWTSAGGSAQRESKEAL
jgi:hypothetical protein